MGLNIVTCYGSNSAIIYGTPSHFPFIGLTAGDGFVCGLLMVSNQPYCWGSSGYIQMGVPQPIIKGAEYVEISAGDYHLCGLRKPLTGKWRNHSFVDCWGYNMTKNYVFDGQIQSISAGSEFNCGLFSQNRTVFCWGDETSSRVISLIPKEMKFQKIAAGGYHVCGVLEGVNSRAFCWGRSLDLEEEISVAYSGQGNVDLPPSDPMFSIVGGKFHACGIKRNDYGIICWGFIIKPSTPPPSGVKVYEIAGGNYFTCGVLEDKSLLPVCWGVGFPASLPLAVSPGLCKTTPCVPGSYEVSNEHAPCKSPNSHVCLPCSNNCPAEMYQKAECTLKLDRVCEYNCSSCSSAECFSNCSSLLYNGVAGKKNERYKLRNCNCSAKVSSKSRKVNGVNASYQKDNGKIRPDLDELKIRRAQMFSYEELERATGGFKEESQVGRGSFSCVYKGVLKDGTVVAAIVKRVVKGFWCMSLWHMALCTNIFMGRSKALKEQLDWIRRVTIAVQAARGIEYLHGYACPPVIHRDIKSSNILIDEEHNARVADFAILDPVLKPPTDLDALKRIANVACKCVRMRGKERPSMDKVTTALERALAQLMGSPCIEQPILPTEVILGSNRLHKKSSQRSSNQSASETDVAEAEDQRYEFRAPSWITFPSVTSSQRRKSSVSEADVDGKNLEARNMGNMGSVGRWVEEFEGRDWTCFSSRELILAAQFLKNLIDFLIHGGGGFASVSGG
ncbi:hypothetical protein Patl1_26370 [Pistacia atlantica]|uniref:Uncharacterized protein n=1 Tax=Pistacia atlantica TaxID=434234 RepID=A0ACC1B1N7_9ROSI|nr:hypothetical protein Patl1_26370 [Pistacia atlantica]